MCLCPGLALVSWYSLSNKTHRQLIIFLSRSPLTLQSWTMGTASQRAGCNDGWLPRQAAALDEHKARLSAAASAVRELGRRREALLSGRLEAVKRREVTWPRSA